MNHSHVISPPQTRVRYGSKRTNGVTSTPPPHVCLSRRWLAAVAVTADADKNRNSDEMCLAGADPGQQRAHQSVSVHAAAV